MTPQERDVEKARRLAYDMIRRTDLDPWQRPEDGFPSDAYFQAVVDTLTAADIHVEDWGREEAWEVNYSLAYAAYADGPLAWAKHGLYVSWRCDQDNEPQHPDDFTGPGWYWVPYTKPNTAGGDYAEKFDTLPYLAEPQDVAEAVAALIGRDA